MSHIVALVRLALTFLFFSTLIAGASAARAEITRIEQTDVAVTLQGNWTTLSRADVSGGTIAVSNTPGASVTVRFSGSAISWIGYRCPCAGVARIYLDGQLVLAQVVDSYASTLQPQAEIYRIGNLVNSSHVLRIEATGARRAEATDAYIGIDAFDVESDHLIVEDSAPAVSYSGNWLNINDVQSSGGGFHAAREAGATATVSFNGTGIEWYGRTDPRAGSARIYVDGNLLDTVDTYAAYGSSGVRVYELDGLVAGDHTLRIEVTGSVNPAGTNSYVVIDRFRVLLPEGNGGIVDTTPPTVVLTRPEPGSTVHGTTVQVFARAQDNIDVTGVSFYVDGDLIGDEGNFPGEVYSIVWDSTRVPDGTHQLTAVARDAAGNLRTSVPVSINVANGRDWEAPTGTITSPGHNALLTGVVTISVDATDNVGVTKVQFVVNGTTVLGEDSTPPYSITRDTSMLPSGRTYRLGARLIDAAGNVGFTSNYTEVTINHEDQVRPTVTITQPADGATVSGTITVAADASDDKGVAGVDFVRPRDWGTMTFGTDASAPFTTAFDTTTLTDGYHYIYARATDINGNAGGASERVDITVDNSVVPGRTRVDDTHQAAVYTGSWYTLPTSFGLGHSHYHWNAAHASGAAGARVSFTFTGTGVRISGNPCFDCGSANVSIDGGAPTFVDTGGGPELGQPGESPAIVYESPVLPYGTHTLELVVLQRYSGIRSERVIVDAFEILNP